MTSSRRRRLVAPTAESDAGSLRKRRTWCKAPSSRDEIGGHQEGAEVEVGSGGGVEGSGVGEGLEECRCSAASFSSSRSLSSSSPSREEDGRNEGLRGASTGHESISPFSRERKQR